MIAYRLKLTSTDEPAWYGTLNDAREAGRQYPRLMTENLIEQFDVPIDKEGILRLLNGGFAEFEPQRQWEFTAKGGLVEVNTEGYRI
jgi:hypothetical protein